MVLKNLFTGQQWRNRQRIDLWTRGEGEMYGESNMKTYITIWKIESQQGSPTFIFFKLIYFLL